MHWITGMLSCVIVIVYDILKFNLIFYCAYKFYRTNSLLARKEAKGSNNA